VAAVRVVAAADVVAVADQAAAAGGAVKAEGAGVEKVDAAAAMVAEALQESERAAISSRT
jgi:hypothetical protein